MLRHNGLSASLIVTSLAASLAVLLVLELSNCLADVYFTQPVSVSAFSSEPKRTLLDGLNSNDSYIKRFAFIELRQLATSDEKKRIDVFTDIKGKSFENISKACLIELGQSYRTLQRRGQSAGARSSGSVAQLSSQPSSQGRSPQNGPERLPVSSENAFRPTQRTFLDSITQPGASTAVIPSVPVPVKAQETISKAKAAATTSLSKVPAIFQQKADEKMPADLKEAAATAIQAAKKVEHTLLDRLQSFTPDKIKRSQYWRYLFEPLLRADVERCLPNPDLDSCAAACRSRSQLASQSQTTLTCTLGTALTAFMVASLHEDQYGVAQSDIPKVLEAFVQYLGALEGYAAELNRAADEGQYPAAIVRARVSESVQPAIDSKSGSHSQSAC